MYLIDCTVPLVDTTCNNELYHDTCWTQYFIRELFYPCGTVHIDMSCTCVLKHVHDMCCLLALPVLSTLFTFIFTTR